MFFVSSHAFAYDLSYLESKILPDSFEMRIYEAIKDVVVNSIPKRQHNMMTFVWKEAKVTIIENARTKTRGYYNPDTIILFTDQTSEILEKAEEVVIVFNQKADFCQFTVRKIRDNTVGRRVTDTRLDKMRQT